MKTETRKTRKAFRENVEGVIEARRDFLRKSALVGAGAAAATGGLGFNIATAQGKTTTWKIQQIGRAHV